MRRLNFLFLPNHNGFAKGLCVSFSNACLMSVVVRTTLTELIRLPK